MPKNVKAGVIVIIFWLIIIFAGGNILTFVFGNPDSPLYGTALNRLDYPTVFYFFTKQFRVLFIY